MRSPLAHGVIYLLLGIAFTYFAINSVNTSGWGLFAYLFIALATFDIGSGLRMILLHFKIKKHIKEKK
ncbi:YdiK family protein [Jeotgalibacillus marinus]|uniref:YdiK family protein n=1 Tax=Jeotgalibacillus marinus TaxID=86667 RepID=A0ABV3Q8Q5_9BACL